MKRTSIIFILMILSLPSFGQSNPELIIRTGHQSDVLSVGFSPDGTKIVSGGADKTIKIWDIKTGFPIRTIAEGHIGGVSDVKFSPDGTMIVSASLDKSVKLWNVLSGELIASFEKHTDEVVSVAFSPNGELIASIGSDKLLIVWDIKSKKEKWAVQGKDVFRSMSFSPDGKNILTGSDDYKLKIWRTQTGKLYKEIQENYFLRGVSYSPDGKNIIYGKGKVLISADANSGAVNWSSVEHSDIIYDIDYSPDGKNIVTASRDESVKIWNSESGKEIKTLKGHTYYVVAAEFSPDAKSIITGSWDKTIRLWDTETGMEIKKLEGAFPVLTTTSSSDATMLLSGGADKILRLWDLKYARLKRSFTGSDGWIKTVTFSPDNQQIVSGCWSFNDNLHLWDIKTGAKLTSFSGHTSWVHSVLFTSDGSKIISASDDKTIKIWDRINGKLLTTLKGHTGAVTDIALSSNEKLILSASWDKTVKIWDISSGNQLYSIQVHDNIVEKILFAGDDRLISATGSPTDPIKLWDIKSGTLIKSLNGHQGRVDFLGNKENVETITLSADGKHLLSGGVDKLIRMWDLESGKILTTFNGHANAVKSISFLNEDGRILSSSDDASLKLWDIATGKEIATLIGHGKSGYLFYTPDNYYSVSKDALAIVAFKRNDQIYLFDQFDLQCNRPDIVLERLGKSSPQTIAAYRKAYEKRIRKMGFDPANFEKERSFNVPEISVPEGSKFFAETKLPEYSISFSASDKLFNLDRFFAEVNGVPLYGVKGKSLLNAKSKDTKQTLRIPLSSGKNVIEISVMNEKGIESLTERFYITYKPTAPIKPNLHVISIGVSKFIESDFNLTYADKDANDFAEMMKTKKDDFADIFVHSFTNEMATKANILKLRGTLEKTAVDDHVYVLIASHGILDKELDYYLALHDMSFTNPKNGGLRYDELENMLDSIPARHKLVLIDACHSGEVDKEESEIIAANVEETVPGVSSRGFKKGKSNETSIGLANSFELMKELFADLRRNNGAIVISSASGKEFAFESSEWKNGVFTYSVLEGLKTGNADLNKDNIISVSELCDYVSKRVQELTKGMQNPTSRTENLENNFRVW